MGRAGSRLQGLAPPIMGGGARARGPGLALLPTVVQPPPEWAADEAAQLPDVPATVELEL